MRIVFFFHMCYNASMFGIFFAAQLFFAPPAYATSEAGYADPLPIQAPLSEPAYSVFFEKASQSVGVGTSECARFVNRIFGARFGFLPFGDAWTMQLAPENQPFLKLVWQLGKDQFDPETLLLLHAEARVEHFRDLYSALEREEYPIGVLGFLYRFSSWSEHIALRSNVLPQTHVAFLAGRKAFEIKNPTSAPQTLEQILVEKFGVIHDFERDFVNECVPLSLELAPGAVYTYSDFLVEEHFREPMSGSLLELFLRKHKNNRTTPLLRPVSFSRISDALIAKIQEQEALLSGMKIEFVTGAEFAALEFPGKEKWTEFLMQKLGVSNPATALLVPIPAEK